MCTDQLESLILVLTLQCPLECAHCIVGSSPQRREHLSTATILRILDEAAELQVRNIGFTGGDPLIRPHDLKICVERARRHKFGIVLITSAFWATSVTTAVEVLRPYSDIAMLGLSTDTYHERFTSIERVRNAVRAAKMLGLTKIEIQTTGFCSESLDKTRLMLGDDAEGVHFRFQHVWPVGRAAALLNEEGALLTPLNRLNMTCPMGAPVITPNGRINGCCSSLLDLGEENPISMGNIENGLAGCLSELFSDPYYMFLKTFGLKALLDLVSASGLHGRLRRKYSDVCHLCHDLHSDAETRSLCTARLRAQR